MGISDKAMKSLLGLTSTKTVYGTPDFRAGDSELLVDNNAFIGLEAELECCPLTKELQYWAQLEDNSLKMPGSYEYILRYPSAGEDIICALTELELAIINANLYPQLTERTSFHVHYDITDLTLSQFIDAVAILVTIEPLLYHYVGEGRARNPYCIPLAQMIKSHGPIVRLALRMAKYTLTPWSVGSFIKKSSKYYGINISSAARLGSLEFRHKEGTYHAEEMLEWINIIMSIMKFATTLTIPSADLPRYISSEGVHRYVTSIFGEYTDKVIYEGYQTDVLTAIRLAQILFDGKPYPDLTKEYNTRKLNPKILRTMKASDCMIPLESPITCFNDHRTNSSSTTITVNPKGE